MEDKHGSDDNNTKTTEKSDGDGGGKQSIINSNKTGKGETHKEHPTIGKRLRKKIKISGGNNVGRERNKRMKKNWEQEGNRGQPSQRGGREKGM